MDVPSAHGLNEPIHVARLAPVGKRKLVLGRGQSQRTDHHRCQGVGKLALEHRSFASDDAVILPHLAKQKRRVNVGKVNLARAFEVAFGALEVLRHYAEIDMLSAKNMPNLPQHLLHAHVAAGVARAVVARKQQLEFLTWRPALAETHHPSEARDLNQRADPRDQKKVRHAPILPATAVFSALGSDGQGLAGYRNLLSRLNFKSGNAYVENFAGASPSSATTRELSKTVFQSRYGQKTFSSEAPYPAAPLRFATQLTVLEKGPPRDGQNLGRRMPPA